MPPKRNISKSMSRQGSRKSMSRQGSRKSMSRQGSRKSMSRQGSRKSMSRQGSRKSMSRQGSRKSMSRQGSRKSNEWNSRNSVCPKTPSHQLTVDRNGSNWFKLTKQDIKKKKNKYEIKRLNKLPGIYIIIVLKENPDIMYLLREFTDLFYRNSIEYPEAPVDDGMIGHSSIYTNTEFQMEWMKELTARDFELKASKTSDLIQKKSLNDKAKRIREQCLLYFAGQLYYDKGIVVWTNHSGHFQPSENVKHKVWLPQEKFVPMGSPTIHKLIEMRYSK